MGNRIVNQDAETFEMDLAEAIGRLGSSMVGIAAMQEEQRKVLAKILKEREQLAELVTALDARVKLLTQLHDHHQATLERAGLTAPRPKGGTLAN